MERPEPDDKLHVLLYQVPHDGQMQWVAHCLDFDIAAPAPDPRGALSDLARMIQVHIDVSSDHGLRPFATCHRAEDLLWERWERGVDVVDAEDVSAPVELVARAA